eukprot:684421-Hanusia_phi.AAC.3
MSERRAEEERRGGDMRRGVEVGRDETRKEERRRGGEEERRREKERKKTWCESRMTTSLDLFLSSWSRSWQQDQRPSELFFTSNVSPIKIPANFSRKLDKLS